MRYLYLILLLVLTNADKVLAQQIPKLGIVSPLSRDSLAHASGFTMLGESVPNLLSPLLKESDFLASVEKINKARCKVISCNLFFPATIKIAGPSVDENKVIGYADTVLFRAGKAGIKYIILGSSGARSIPLDYSQEKAKNDFVTLCKKLALLAEKYNVTILLENLQSKETNFLSSLKSAAEVVRRVNHPAFKLNADIFHMMRENESPQEIVNAGSLITFCEIAEKEKRSLPGVMGDDFKPYLKALKEINYHGFIFMEGAIEHPETELPLAFKYLSNQLSEVYLSK
ncbi:sugar phosphate isomerase/epimerase family protein [Pedobacter jamesrossensis]|uniref:Sugar phosphate isomerase/epimerase family protein n=1 Tax=Pedobacter jamesrossensis TaxID=1908238 RepID=A0ABV8NK46_9SPHI